MVGGAWTFKEEMDALTEEVKSTIHKFYEKEATCLLNKKTVKKNIKKKSKPRYVLRQSLKRMYQLFCEEFPNLRGQVGLTSFVKCRPKNVLLQSKMKWLQCL